MNQVFADCVTPNAFCPIITVGVALKIQMIASPEPDQAIGIVDPAVLRAKCQRGRTISFILMI
jgi:hypothetical protein